MAQKKDRSRFSIKFRESDPAHERTICILESQGQRNIAPFIVNAVLHYVQCSATPDISHMLAENPQALLDRNVIENIVVEILRQQGVIKEELQKIDDMQVLKAASVVKEIKAEQPDESVIPQNIVNNDMRAMIARTLSAFRSE